MRTRLLAFFALALALPLQAASAQIEHGGAPPSARLELSAEVPTLLLPAVDNGAFLARDAARSEPGPLLFGEVLALDAGLEDAGAWEELGGGARVWRLRIASPGAHSLSLLFSRFQLPPGAELFVHDDSRSTVRGAYTHDNVKPSGEFAIQPIAGDALTLEYVEPPGRAGELRLSGVVHDYRDVLPLLDGGGSGDSGGNLCLVDVSCPEGDPWRNQINSSLQVISSGALCSGALLNNTARDGKQLFLSAEHCGPMTNAVFRFNYQRPRCAGGTAPTNMTVQGAVQLASSTGTDFRLMRILTPIPASYGARLGGWDRRKNQPTQMVVGVSHPAGSIKRITISNQPPSSSGVKWQVILWDVGQPLPGSSGSPLFTETGRQIGVLSVGGRTVCGSTSLDGYIRLDAFWDRVRTHLDPLGTGRIVLGALDPHPTTIASVAPAPIEALLPGTARSVVVNGSGFPPYAKIDVDGVELAASRYSVVDDTRIEIDLPQVSALGSVPLVVRDGSDMDTTTIELVAPASPRLQLGPGDPLSAVSQASGMDVVVGGQVGSLHYVFYSPSNLPSANATVSFDIGNGFTELFLGGAFVIPATGWDATNAPIPVSAVGSVFYAQSVALDGSGAPLPTSNVQSVTIVP